MKFRGHSHVGKHIPGPVLNMFCSAKRCFNPHLGACNSRTGVGTWGIRAPKFSKSISIDFKILSLVPDLFLNHEDVLKPLPLYL